MADNTCGCFFNSLPNDKILDRSKLNEFADHYFRFGEKKKISKRVENTAGNGEIARYEQFLLFLQCFKRFVQQTRKTAELVWKRVNSLPNDKILYWYK